MNKLSCALIGFLGGLFLNLGLVSAIEIGLKWNPNTETDLAGYKVYRSTVIGGPYILLKELREVSSSPSFIWVVPPNTEQTYYWVITAFDEAGNESGYSGEVSAYIDNKAPGAPSGTQIIVIVIPK